MATTSQRSGRISAFITAAEPEAGGNSTAAWQGTRPATNSEDRSRPAGLTQDNRETNDHMLQGSAIQIGRASCRERGCQYGEHLVVAGAIKKKKTNHHLT